MAIATQKRNIWFYSSADGVPPEIKNYPIAASQGIYMPGAPVYVSTSGTVKLCDTADGSDAWHGFLVSGVAAELAADTVVRVQMIRANQLWAVYVSNTDADIVAAQTRVGDQLGLRVQTAAGQIGYTTCDVANANAVIQVVDLMSNVEPSKYSTSDSPGVILVKFLTAVIQAAKA